MDMPTHEIKRLHLMVESASKWDLGPALDFNPMSHIQVKWAVPLGNVSHSVQSENNGKSDAEEDSSSEEEETELVWWNAKVVGKTSEFHQVTADEEVVEEGKGKEENTITLPVYQIRYEAMPPLFPTAEMSFVCLLGKHQLIDRESDAVLPWRFEGDSWEEIEGNEEEENPFPFEVSEFAALLATKCSPVGTTSLRDSIEDCELQAQQVLMQILTDLNEKHDDTVKAMDPFEQSRLAQRTKDFLDEWVPDVARILHEKGSVCEDDILQLMNQKRSS